MKSSSSREVAFAESREQVRVRQADTGEETAQSRRPKSICEKHLFSRHGRGEARDSFAQSSFATVAIEMLRRAPEKIGWYREKSFAPYVGVERRFFISDTISG